MWLTQDKGRNWQQFREVLASSELALVFPKDSRVQINARKANAEPYEYQATAVWKEGKAPPEYRSREWHEELQRVASCVRQRVPIVEPLTISSTREGVVQEFISYETGLVRLLDQDKGVVLFCLENVWVSEGGTNICLAEKDDRLLQDFIPVGSKVEYKKFRIWFANVCSRSFALSSPWPQRVTVKSDIKLLLSGQALIRTCHRFVNLVTFECIVFPCRNLERCLIRVSGAKRWE